MVLSAVSLLAAALLFGGMGFFAAVVAPLRLARGIQNKVLEAMAMARPVVASPDCAAPIEARLDEELLAANDAADYVRHISSLLADGDRRITVTLHPPIPVAGHDRKALAAAAERAVRSAA